MTEKWGMVILDKLFSVLTPWRCIYIEGKRMRRRIFFVDLIRCSMWIVFVTFIVVSFHLPALADAIKLLNPFCASAHSDKRGGLSSTLAKCQNFKTLGTAKAEPPGKKSKMDFYHFWQKYDRLKFYSTHTRCHSQRTIKLGPNFSHNEISLQGKKCHKI